MKTQALYPVLMTRDLRVSRDFYLDLLGWEVTYEADFYVSLLSPERTAQLAFVTRDYESVPATFRKPPAGQLVTVEIDDVDGLYAWWTSTSRPVVLDLRSEPWGQRHFMVEDPNGILVDLVQVIPPDAEHAAAYTDADPGGTS
jgi:catechol 2,3-dioxygenase-like lactoylglutathione lyase family enzyme